MDKSINFLHKGSEMEEVSPQDSPKLVTLDITSSILCLSTVSYTHL